mmetsp:Transcript_26927/g.4926  ORF Transcript_26927/g.4926 Transcript_26927/m.4926 type:complete len:83 (-) Transcript_26927:7336-7584(-)
MHIFAKESLVWATYSLDKSSNTRSYSFLLATLIKASSGHAFTQLIVQQLTKEGKSLILILRVSPIGLMHSTICKFSLTLYIK